MPETRSQSGSISGDSESHDEENGGQNSGEQKRFYLKNISPPGHLKAKADDPNSKTLWLSWKRAWNRYLLLSGINKQPKEFVAALLLHSIGPDGVTISEGFAYENENDCDDPEIVLQKYDEYFIGTSREFIQRMKFYRRKQLQNETFEQFLNELRQMSKTCGFCKCMWDKMIMDRIIDGHKSKVVKEKLVAQDDPDLKSVINMCRAMELTESDLKVANDQAEKSFTTKEVNKVSSKYQHKKKSSTFKKPFSKSQDYKSHENRNKTKICKFCGQDHIISSVNSVE